MPGAPSVPAGVPVGNLGRLAAGPGSDHLFSAVFPDGILQASNWMSFPSSH